MLSETLRFLKNILFSNSVKPLKKREPYTIVNNPLMGVVSASPARCENFSETFKKEILLKK